MAHGLFEEKVALEPISHTYTDKEGNTYVGFSKVFESICKPFNKDFIAGLVAESGEKTKEQVIGEWDAKRDNGTRIDDALGLYLETGLIKEADSDIKELIISVSAEYKKYKKNFSQVIVYNEERKTAGAIDRTFLFTYQKDANFGMSDYKCFEKDDLHERRGWLLEPFNHLPNSKFVKIAFQLSYYAFHFEELTGRKCNELFIHVINPLTQTHQKVFVPYLRNDVKLLLDVYRCSPVEVKNIVAEETNEAF